MVDSEAFQVTLLVTSLLDELGVPYVIGGSMASIIHGMLRTTMDVDIVADMQPKQVSSFLSGLQDAFYADEQTIRQAIQRRSSFNLIHLSTMFKVDIFIPKGRPFDQQQLGRRPDDDLNEALYQFHHHGQTVQVKKPCQHATSVTVLATAVDNPAIMGDLHSHGNMSAFFSRTDDADEQATKVYAVTGKLDTAPEIRLRVGAYGYWLPLPVTAVFTGNGPFKDLHEERDHDK